jgi:hypothetical protein
MRVFSLYRSTILSESASPQAPTNPGQREEGIALQKTGGSIGKFLILAIQLGVLPWAPRADTGHGNRRPGRLQQGRFGWGCRVQEVSHRNTLAVDRHHPLRTLATCGLPDTGPPFFAGTKLPSVKVSAQSSWPWVSSWDKKLCQAFSHTPCSSHSWRCSQQVLAEGNRSGRSFHRAPLRKLHRMPSKTGRFEIGFGPLCGDACGSANKGAIFAHWISVSSECSLAIGRTPFAVLLQRKCPADASSRSKEL